MAKGRGYSYMGAEAPPDYVFSGSKEYDDLFRKLQEDIYRTRWTPNSVIQSPTAFTGGGVLAPVVLGTGAYYAGKNDLIGRGIDTVKNVDYATIPDRLGGAINEKLIDGAIGLIEGGRKVSDYIGENFMRPVMENPIYKKYYNDPLISFLENKSNSVPTEGPMRFAGREVAHHGPVTSGGPLSRGNSYERYLGRMEERYRNGIPEYNTPDYRLAGPDWLYDGTSIGHGEGQVDPSFYKTPYVNDATDPMYQNRVAINADISALEKELEAQLEAELAAEAFQDALPYATGVVASHEIPGYDRMVNEGYDSWSPSDAVDTRSDWQKWKDSFKEGWKAK